MSKGLGAALQRPTEMAAYDFEKRVMYFVVNQYRSFPPRPFLDFRAFSVPTRSQVYANIVAKGLLSLHLRLYTAAAKNTIHNFVKSYR